MTTPFPFTIGQVLTAAQLNAITELVVNDKTASHTLTAADAGDRVIMNSASATTITVNTSIFTAGQVIYVTNKGAGVCTITAGTATVSTTGTLALSQFASGVLYCISAGVFLFEAYGVAASASGATLVLAQSFTTVASVSMAAGTFTSSFQNYLVMLQITANSTNQNIALRVNNAGTPRTASNYGGAKLDIRQNDGVVIGTPTNAQSSFNMITSGTNNPGGIAINVFSPLVATTKTSLTAQGFGIDNGVNTGAPTFGGVQYGVAEANDGLTFIVGGTFSGNLRVYGLADS